MLTHDPYTRLTNGTPQKPKDDSKCTECAVFGERASFLDSSFNLANMRSTPMKDVNNYGLFLDESAGLQMPHLNFAS